MHRVLSVDVAAETVEHGIKTEMEGNLNMRCSEMWLQRLDRWKCRVRYGAVQVEEIYYNCN